MALSEAVPGSDDARESTRKEPRPSFDPEKLFPMPEGLAASPPRTTPARRVDPSSAPSRSWREDLADILRPGDPPGAVVVLSATPGLVAVQTELLRLVPERECLTARYRIEGQVSVPTLVAAFAGDLCALRDGRTGSLGDLQTRDPGAWADYLPRLGTDTGWLDDAASASTLTNSEAFDVLRRLCSVLGTSGRLVLLATTDEVGLFFAPLVLSAATQLPPQLVLGLGVFVPPDVPGPLIPPDAIRQVVRASPHAVLLEGVPADEARTEVAYLQDRRANLSADQPGTVDLLGREQLARTLAALLMHPDTGPLCVGVEAPWGKGKSTFLNLVKRGLEEPGPRDTTDEEPQAQRATVVQFDAWQYDTAEQAWAGLARAVIGGIEASLGVLQRARMRLSYARRFRSGRLVRTGLLVLAGLVVTAALFLVGGQDAVAKAGAKTPLAQVFAVAVGQAAVSLLIVLLALVRAMRPVADRVSDYLAAPAYGDRLGFQHEVIRDLQFSKDWLTGVSPTTRVVVMVDDLDRCSDDKTVQLLQAINVVLAASGLFVLIGLDGDVVRRAVYRHYVRDEEKLAPQHRLPFNFAEDYLRKIIQFSIHLPASSAVERVRFLDGLLRPHVHEAEQVAAPVQGEAATIDLSRVLSPWPQEQALVRDTDDDVQALRAYERALPDNPREVKRLVNVHRFVKIAIRETAEDLPPRTQRLLVQLLVVCAVHPEQVPDLLALADRGTAQDLLLGKSWGPGWNSFVTTLRQQLPEDVLTAEDLRAGAVLRQAAELAVHIP